MAPVLILRCAASCDADLLPFAAQLGACPVCFEEFVPSVRTPRLLTCSHTFCEDCLVQLTGDVTASSAAIICPLCRSVTTLLEDGHPSPSPRSTSPALAAGGEPFPSFPLSASEDQINAHGACRLARCADAGRAPCRQR